MRIAIDALLLHGQYSGVEHSIRDLIQALQDLDTDHEFFVYAPGDVREGELSGRTLSLRRAPFSGRSRMARVLWEHLVLPGVLRRDGVDVLHGPGYVLPWRCPVPAVVSLHDVIALVRPDLCTRSNAWHYRLVVPHSASQAALVIVHSQHTRGEVEGLGIPGERLRVIPLGVRPAFRRVTDASRLADVRARYGLPPRYFVCVGNIEPKKNLWGAIDAFGSYARSGGPVAGLVVAGQRGWVPPLFDRLLAESDVRDRVLALGYVPDDDLPALYSASEALLFPSLYEGTGLPPLEAMACGTPVICSDRAALPETVGDAAITLSMEDDLFQEPLYGRMPFAFVPGMAEAMRRVAEDREFRDELVARGFERAAQFTWDRHARETLRAYEAAAAAEW